MLADCQPCLMPPVGAPGAWAAALTLSKIKNSGGSLGDGDEREERPSCSRPTPLPLTNHRSPRLRPEQ